MIRFLQVNIGVGRAAQDLMVHTARDYGADVVLVSEQYRNLGEDIGWYSDVSGRAAIYVVKDISIDAIGPADIGFRWIAIKGVRIYSVYCSPNISVDEYNEFLNRLEDSMRRANGPLFVGGDFNAKRPEWGSQISDIRGDSLAELLCSLDLHVCNVGDHPTFTRGASESFIDITLVSRSLWSKVTNWRVLDEESMSLHWYITFKIATTAPTPVLSAPKGWSWRKLDRERLLMFLETKSISDFGDIHSQEVLPNDLNAYLEVACNYSMPIKSYHGRKKSVHWWTQEISELRKTSLPARRRFQRARKRRGPDECRELEQVMREALKHLRIAIRKSQEDSWRNLCQLVDNDPWGLPYKLVTRKLIGKRPIPGLSLPGRLQDIVHGLFPTKRFVEWQLPPVTETFEPITAGELVELANALPNGKAPGPDGVPDMVVKAVILKKPAEVANIFNKCMRNGCFPSAWKEARLV